MHRTFTRSKILNSSGWLFSIPTTIPGCILYPSLPCFTPWRLTPCDCITVRLPCPVALGWKALTEVRGWTERKVRVFTSLHPLPRKSWWKGSCSPPQMQFPEEDFLHGYYSLQALAPLSFLLYLEARPEDGFWLQTSLLYLFLFPTPTSGTSSNIQSASIKFT